MEEQAFMARAIELARIAPFTSPNPRVGAVIAAGTEIVGEGNHQGAGTAHAEAIALDAAGERARGATLYANLEPCVHEGRTPPCAPAIVAAGVARVVAAIEDPDERVSGKGFAYLRDHGVEVDTGLLDAGARTVNRAYLHQRATDRPLVTLKLALSLDGRLAAADGSSRWISSDAARALVHRRRAEADAVMLGAGSVIADDPQLTARDVAASRQPARVIVDARGRVGAAARVFGAGEVLVATTPRSEHEVQVGWKETGAEVLVLAESEGRVDLVALVDALATKGWLEVICEGGGELATSLLRADLVDRLELHYGPVLLGRGGPEIGDVGITSMDDADRWSLTSVDRLGDSALLVLDRKRD